MSFGGNSSMCGEQRWVMHQVNSSLCKYSIYALTIEQTWFHLFFFSLSKCSLWWTHFQAQRLAGWWNSFSLETAPVSQPYFHKILPLCAVAFFPPFLLMWNSIQFMFKRFWNHSQPSHFAGHQSACN